MIDTIDVYRQSEEYYIFPSRKEFLEALPPGVAASFHDCGGYDLADCCPIFEVFAG
jgi:hypothetical protein